MSESTESSQKSALPYDEVEAAPYDRAATLQARLSTLAKASSARVAGSREFRWIKEDMARWEKQKKDKSLSLNEKTRLAERKVEEDRQAERKKERSDRKEKPFTSEEITLAILDGKVPAVAPSTATVTSRPPDDEDEPGYEHAADAPDAVLDETLRIASDLAVAAPPPNGQAARRDRGTFTQ